MSVLEITRAQIDPPARLPVDYLSVSSLKQLMMCPEKWYRRYILKQVEPSSGKMLLGSAAGACLAQHFGRQIETGEGISTEELLDEFSAEWDDRTGREDVQFGDDEPGKLKDSGAAALRIYHRMIAPSIAPVSVERKIEMRWPGVDWCLTGFIDLEDGDDLIRDYKMTAKRISQATADGDLQATTYLVARRAEGNPAAGFCFDALLRQAKPSAETVTTGRTEQQLDLFTDRVFGLAREIEWRCETGNWGGAAPGTWFCSTCRYRDCDLRLS